MAFFARVRAGYALRAQAAPRRFVRIDAGQPLAAVRAAALAALEAGVALAALEAVVALAALEARAGLPPTHDGAAAAPGTAHD